MAITLRTLLAIVLLTSFGLTSKAQVQVISPNGGETWMSGLPSLVSFSNSGAEDWFLIEFSADSGSTWSEIDWVYGFTGSNEVYTYSWIEETTQALIRVSNYYNQSIFDESDNVFTVVVPPYYIYSPGLGDYFYEGQNIFVQWSTTNTNPVNVEFSADNGSTWTLMGTTSFAYFSFPAPEGPSDTCLIRLSDSTDSTVNALSPVFSVIPAPTINLTSPNGGEVWEYGEEYTVSWTGEGLNYYVVIEFSADGGNTWYQQTWAETTPTGGSAIITPLMLPTTNARIRVSDYYSEANDQSDADFTVNAPAFLVTSPYDGSVFYTNTQIGVQWYSYLNTTVDIQLSVDNGATYETVLTGLQANQGYALFDGPAEPSENCIIKIVDSNNASLFGISDIFRIIPLPVLTLTFPAGGEILDNDSTYTITWNLSGELIYYSYGYIDLSMDNGVTWQNIGWSYDLEQENSFEWTTPLQTSDECLIRVGDYYNDFISAVSQSTFSIKDFPTLDICMVTVDSASGKNMVVWNKVNSDLIAEYVVLKESNVANQYVEVGSVSANAVSVMIDNSSDPNEKATRYKLTFRDSSNVNYPSNKLHQTIHLSINKGVGANWNLYWNSYLGFPVSSYNIYRGTSPSDLQMIGTVSGNFTSFTDQTAPAGFVYYMVEVVNPNQCDPEGGRSSFYGSSRSNIATNKTLGFDEKAGIEGLVAYPNPSTDIIRIRTSAELKGDVRVLLVSSSGSIISDYSVNGNLLNDGLEIETTGLPEGIYSVVLSNEQKSASIRFIKQE